MKQRVIILILSVVLIGVVLFVFNFYKKPGIPAEETIPIEINNILQAQDGLPPAVEAKRQAIYRAAISRNYENLNKEASVDFHYSFGGEYEGGFIGYLKLSETNERESAFDVIPTLLQLPYATKDNLYTWPSVFTVEPSKWTEEDINMMKTFLTEEQIESYRQYGGYIYYRLGIKSTGEWVFYLAGD